MTKHIYEVTSGKEHDIAMKLATFQAPWLDETVTAEFKEVLGVDIDKNMAIFDGALHIQHVPETLRPQFKKNRSDGYLVAKANSNINKKFLEIVNKHGLETHHTIELTILLRSGYGNPIQFTHIVGRSDNPSASRMFVALKDSASNKDVAYFDEHGSLTKTTNKAYHQLVADNEED